MIPDQINILLTPDASSGRRVRRVVAERGLGLGVKVVTWPEILDEARSAYLLPAVGEDWNETVKHAIEQMAGGFWWRSFEVDPTGTASAIASSLEEFIRSGGTEEAWSHPSLSGRTNAILSDLRDLWDRMDNVLPPELTLINGIQKAPDRAISQFSVHRIDDWPRLDRFQTRLANSLNERGETPSEDLLSILRETASLPDILEETPPPQKLASLCFSGRKGALLHDDNIAFLVARDPLQEIECAAGIIQSFVGRGIAPRDIGALVPDDPYYQRSMADVFSVVGTPTAGLPSQIPMRDLGGEVVRSLILLARGPVPKMALASLVASPIAPWPSDIGAHLSSDVMAGRFELRAPHGMSKAGEKFLSLIRRLRDGKASIVDTIEVFAQDADDPVHVSRLRSLAKLIAEQTRDGQADHDRLLELVDHVTATVDQPTRFPLNGVRVFQENQEPWTSVKHLLVLGFNRGRYPSLPGAAPVLHDLEKQSINEHLGWDLPTSDTILATRWERFQRQIATATETVKFLASARTIDGSLIQPAETATFLAGLLGQEPDDLFAPIHLDDKWLPRADETFPVPPRQPAADDLDLDRDLLALRTDEDGEPLPESPSSLETLLVSPLAWLLGRIDAEPDPWEPDTMGILLQGNIAHGVFERLFTVDGDIIEKDAVEEAVDAALSEAIRQQVPLLSTAQWKVERHSLRTTLIQAVANWRDVLETLNAKIVGVEARLRGKFGGIPIKGFSDEIVQLPGGKLVVVDFKKSSSGKRRDRMDLGYDCQVSLYEKMISENRDELGLDGTSENPGIVYYTLNDQRVLADDRTGLPPEVPGLVVVSNDVSSNALREIEDRLEKLRRGVVEMNQEDDAKRLDKVKALPGFALEASPLVMMFAHPNAAEGS